MTLVARRPSQELVDLVGALGGTWHGYVAMCRCPAHDDHMPSLSLRQGDHGILVTCFAGCAREDVLRELQRIPRGRRCQAPAAGAIRAGNPERIWKQAHAIPGTLAERYLARRGLLPSPQDVRFHPRCPFLPKPQTVFLPALLVAVRETTRLVAIQRIFLDPASASYTRKVMLGRPGRGSWRAGGEGSTLAIAEGFETARAFTLLHDIPCWAALGARRLDRLSIPSHVTSLLIAADNDAEGRRAAALAEVAYARPNLEIRRAPPPACFKDWAKVIENQLKRGGGPGL